METAITAVAGELLSRFISFTINKFCSSYVCSEKEERLQHLLMRAHTVVEEADGRHISNSGMLMQLKVLSEAMYQGYHALDTLRFQLRDECMDKVSDSFSISSATRLKRRRTILSSVNRRKVLDLDVHGALKTLETVMSNIAEFVVLLGGCERMSRRPYDAYLYIGNYMFGRHVEKQKLLNFLLQHNPDEDAPAVLPIIGGLAVGKKTLVAHVCTYESIRSQFPSILHMNGDNFLTIVDHEKVMLGTALVVVEFVSDIDDMEWEEFYSFVARTNKRTKSFAPLIVIGIAQVIGIRESNELSV
ncbi:hypothetical protein HU200_047959 [Digitaria exilis]|uniref:Rx N-terminal domain-containing protein n=1 Tax=Digitaria exilis TaxID=1010633 RepID=A0A835E837_9POAL|nr:hypothetical protein HU200_047959 [Digitaria exilis]